MLKDPSKNMDFSRQKESGVAMAMDRQALLDISAAISLKNLLFFFSLIFRYPREAVHEELGRLLPKFNDFLHAYADSVPELPEVADLQAEYIRLFVNNRSGVPAVPYASCHLNGGALKGESYYKLCQIMEKSGFALDENVGELEDHLAVLLEFASMLTDRLIETSTSRNMPTEEIMDSFREVITRYLRPLAKGVLAGVSKSTAMDFYSASVWALHNFLSEVEKIYAYVFGVSVAASSKRGVKK